MSKEEFKKEMRRKLTSRKFWIAVTGLVTGVIIACRGSAETAETVSGIIMAAASVVGYLLGEGLTDSARAGIEQKEETPEPEPEPEEEEGEEQ
jgi:hypothetical protein